MGEPRLAIVIPAYREQASIGSVVAGALEYGDVLVIDDCSPDETARCAASAGATVIRNSENLGYDGTLTRGLREARERGFTHMITLDADGEHDPACLGEFRARLIRDNVALVLGVRPHKQRFAEIVMGIYFRWRFGVRDILCGMKGYDLSAFAPGEGFGRSIGTSLALSALLRDLAFAQVQVRGRPRMDVPRFDRWFRANMRIFTALVDSVARGSR